MPQNPTSLETHSFRDATQESLQDLRDAVAPLLETFKLEIEVAEIRVGALSSLPKRIERSPRPFRGGNDPSIYMQDPKNSAEEPSRVLSPARVSKSYGPREAFSQQEQKAPEPRLESARERERESWGPAAL